MRIIPAILAAAMLAACGKAVPEPELAPAEAALQRGREFLAENGRRAGVTTTPSGLQYEVISNGTGERPTAVSEVTVHYEGTLIDGTVFDSSIARGEPATFPLERVIPGWTEGVQLMPVGAKYRFWIPTELAYGAAGVGPIGSNEALVFTVELLAIAE